MTILFFMSLEIISRTTIPALGFTNLLFPVHIIFIIFCGLHFNNPFLPFCILFIHILHNIFSVESWSYGTINGIVICLEINLLKNILNISAKTFIFMISVISTISWYLFNAIFIYIQSKNIIFSTQYIWNSIIEIIIITALAPFLLNVLNRIWRKNPTDRIRA